MENKIIFFVKNTVFPFEKNKHCMTTEHSKEETEKKYWKHRLHTYMLTWTSEKIQILSVFTTKKRGGARLMNHRAYIGTYI